MKRNQTNPPRPDVGHGMWARGVLSFFAHVPWRTFQHGLKSLLHRKFSSTFLHKQRRTADSILIWKWVGIGNNIIKESCELCTHQGQQPHGCSTVGASRREASTGPCIKNWSCSWIQYAFGLSRNTAHLVSPRSRKYGAIQVWIGCKTWPTRTQRHWSEPCLERSASGVNPARDAGPFVEGAARLPCGDTSSPNRSRTGPHRTGCTGLLQGAPQQRLFLPFSG